MVEKRKTVTRFHIGSIRTRILLAFVAMVLLTAVAISSGSALVGFQSGYHQVINQLDSVATLKEAEINSWLREMQLDLNIELTRNPGPELIATLLQSSPDSAEFKAAYLMELNRFEQTIKLRQKFEELFLMDLRGQVILSTQLATTGEFRGLQPYFKAGLKKAGVHVQTLSFSSTSEGINTVVVVAPVVNEQGQVSGVLAGQASLDTLNGLMLERAGLGQSGETYLIGSNHILLTELRVPGYEPGQKYVHSDGVNAVLEEQINGSGGYNDYQDVPVLGIYRWLPNLQVALVAEQNRSEAFAPMYTRLAINISVVVVAAVLVAGALSVIIAGSIARPVADLAETATQIAAGHMELTARVEREDEIGALARAFNHMTTRLRELIRNLEQEIAGHKQTGQSLAEQHRLLRTLIDNMPDLIYVKDGQSRFLVANKTVARLMGGTPDELIGKKDVDFYRPDIAQQFYADEQAVIKTGRALINHEELVPTTSQWRWLSTTKVPFEDETGKIKGLVGIGRDITDRRQAEEALRESEERFRTLLQNVQSVAVQGYGMDGTTQYWNQASERLYGYTAQEAIGQNLLDLIIPPEMKEGVKHAIRQMSETGQPIPTSDLILMRKDGSRVAVFSSHAIVQRPGFGPELFCLDIDLTERKVLEAENKKLTEQFYQAQKMDSIGQLAGGIAHDFNNLLVPIIGYAELGLIAAPPGSKLYGHFEQVKEAGDRAANLTRQILAFSRQQVLEMKVVDLNQVVFEFEKMLQRLIGEHISLKTHLAADLPAIKADPGQLEQVLLNLVVNARDAMPDGGQLTLETTNVTLDEAYVAKHAEAQPGAYVRLTVSDTGHGMDTVTRQRIFEPFFTTKARGHGTGLGLSTVFGIIKQHGGHIWVYSEPGRGTTFKVYLPVADMLVVTVASDGPADGRLTGAETILVVDDEAVVRQLVSRSLREYGYRVLAADDPSQALALATANPDPIHLLLTDVIMPGQNGRELYQQLVVERPGLKVLYMSGYTDDAIANHGVLDEGVAFLRKPFAIRRLLEKVRAVLG